ncbi:MAG: ABC transporter ATP-binding protein/permease [Propionibacteriaceae bacterium]|jgi:ATP-binding cassette subfamily B protein|nr:ABC transporter ATP-binding protein/permease [Propionibacteriaceae bacterium]
MSENVENAVSVNQTTEKKVANERPKYAPKRRGGGPGHGGPMGMGAPAEKAINFLPSLKRLASYLKPERLKLVFVVILGAIGVALNVYSPKLLGKATDVIFSGVIGTMVGNQLSSPEIQAVIRQMGMDPSNLSKDDVLKLLDMISQLPAGQGPSIPTQMLDLLRSVDFTPGVGIDFSRLAMIIFIAIGLYVASALVFIVMGWLLNGIVQRTVYSMREQIAGKLDRLPLEYFDKSPRGELLSRVTNDIDNISQSLQQTLQQLVQSVLMLIGVLVMMLSISWVLTLVAVATIPVSLIAVMGIAKQSQKRFAAMWKETGELNAQVEEAYTGHALVKVFGRHREVETQFDGSNGKLFSAAFGAQAISGLIMPIMNFIGNLGYVAIAVIGGLRVASGQISLGDVQAFIQYQRQFTQPIQQLASMANLLQSGVASAERVFEVLDETEETPDGDAHLPSPLAGRVEFSHVAFSYEPDKPLITDLSLTAEDGATIAIVGPTGAGKTTLVNLLMRFYNIDSGTITLDDVDTVTVPRAELRGEVGMVLQDTWLFHGTIRENIAYGRPDATEEEIMAAAKTTYVDRFVRSLPDGYDTVIDEEGSNVSAGEKQLLTIARAFLADPAILILDEATSSVDTRTEVLVQRAMGALRKGRTSFVIAHRLSTIRDADTILVMEHGDIVEQGNHATLLGAKGVYYTLYQSQFAGVAEEG